MVSFEIRSGYLGSKEYIEPSSFNLPPISITGFNCPEVIRKNGVLIVTFALVKPSRSDVEHYIEDVE